MDKDPKHYLTVEDIIRSRASQRMRMAEEKAFMGGVLGIDPRDGKHDDKKLWEFPRRVGKTEVSAGDMIAYTTGKEVTGFRTTYPATYNSSSIAGELQKLGDFVVKCKTEGDAFAVMHMCHEMGAKIKDSPLGCHLIGEGMSRPVRPVMSNPFWGVRNGETYGWQHYYCDMRETPLETLRSVYKEFKENVYRPPEKPYEYSPAPGVRNYFDDEPSMTKEELRDCQQMIVDGLRQLGKPSKSPTNVAALVDPFKTVAPLNALGNIPMVRSK